MNELVKKLSTGSHPVEISLRPSKTLSEFKKCLDRNYVHIKFTNTKGGTELGVRLDSNLSDFTRADIENGTGTVHLAGTLTLDYTKVRCVADIDVQTLDGQGHLEPIEVGAAV